LGLHLLGSRGAVATASSTTGPACVETRGLHLPAQGYRGHASTELYAGTSRSVASMPPALEDGGPVQVLRSDEQPQASLCFRLRYPKLCVILVVNAPLKPNVPIAAIV
jgi:hypothetical protein